MQRRSPLIATVNRSSVNADIIPCHPCDSETLFKHFSTMCATDLRNAVNRFRRILQVLRNKSCLAILYHFRYRAGVVCNYRRPAGDGLNHYKTERFGPIDGKEQGVSVTQKIIFFRSLISPTHSTCEASSSGSMTRLK